MWCGCCGVGAVKYRNRTEEHKSEAEKIAPPHNNTQNITDSIGIILFLVVCCNINGFIYSPVVACTS